MSRLLTAYRKCISTVSLVRFIVVIISVIWTLTSWRQIYYIFGGVCRSILKLKWILVKWIRLNIHSLTYGGPHTNRRYSHSYIQLHASIHTIPIHIASKSRTLTRIYLLTPTFPDHHTRRYYAHSPTFILLSNIKMQIYSSVVPAESNKQLIPFKALVPATFKTTTDVKFTLLVDKTLCVPEGLKQFVDKFTNWACQRSIPSDGRCPVDIELGSYELQGDNVCIQFVAPVH